MILDQLLGDFPRFHFLDHYYLKHPLARPGGCTHLTEVPGWSFVEHLLAQPGVDFLAARPEKVWEGGIVPTLAQARQLLTEGYTLRFRAAERHHPALLALAQDFQQAFAAPVDIHLYCTPAKNPGLNWHFDAEEVFILQTAGSKSWWVRKNTVHPWPVPESIPQDMRYERELMPALQCQLQAGDWLYVPGGFWHRTQADSESISLSLGVMATTALDVYNFLHHRLLQSILWRQRLPTPGTASTLTEAELQTQYLEVFQELGKDLLLHFSSQKTVSEFLSHRRTGSATESIKK